MMRPLSTEVAPLPVQFVPYAILLTAAGARVSHAKASAPRRSGGLVIAPSVVMIASFPALGQLSDVPPGSTCILGHIENGRLVPGATR